MDEATRQFVFAHLHDDVRALALRSAPDGVDMRYALQQIEARRILAEKVPTWARHPDVEFPPHLSVEQCSSEAAARYKGGLLSGRSFVDLTGGLGVDCHFVAQRFAQADYVEREPHLAALAERNFAVLGDDIRVHRADCVAFLRAMPEVDAAYIDPARRDAVGRKTVSIADCTPNVVELQDLLLAKARRVLVKLSPMLDIALLLRELRCVKAVHIVAVGNECKEILALLERGFADEPTVFAVNLPDEKAFAFRLSDEKRAACAWAEQVRRYLYEPHAALLKAGAFRSVAARYDLLKLHINSHLYTSDSLRTDFPGRVFEVVGAVPFDKKTGKTLLADTAKANLTVRNFPLSVAELRKKLKLAEGGDIYLFATTLSDGRKVIVRCRKAQVTLRTDVR